MDELPESSAGGSNSGGQMESLDYLRGVESSTCLLLTPSPTPLDFKHPLSEEMNEGPFITLNDEPIVNLQNLANCDASGGDSCSSADSNSAVQEFQDPVSAQLINNISMMDYQTLSKNADLVTGEVEDCKTNGSLNFGNRKLPNFVNWNWCVIRKVMLWVVLSGLVACLGAIIGMVISIPKMCDPDLPWYQGKVFYEVFPASFKDSNNDNISDLKGVIMKLDYMRDLNISAIRLNYIYQAVGYPEHYYNVTSLRNIDSSIGDLVDFKHLVSEAHNRGMSIILDIPVKSLAYPHSLSSQNATQLRYSDATSDAIDFWSRICAVDGFYLKDLEKYVSYDEFGHTLKLWKQIIGFDKILIASEEAYNKAEGDNLNMLLSRIDLIDVHLDTRKGINELKDKIKSVINGPLWSKPHYPWVHWNIGNINSPRVATKDNKNALALSVLELILPGTVSIFYGDEIGLGDMPQKEAEQDYHEYENVRNLVQMKFSNKENGDKNSMQKHVQWSPESGLPPNYDFLRVIKEIVKLRLKTPTIYLRSFFKDGNVLKNMEIRNVTDEAEQNLFIIERWYPRRNTCVFVANLGNSSITTDLTTMYYGGTVISGTNSSLIGQVMYFEHVTFPPHSAIVLKLEK
ncbi:uncharacterized protein LOC125230220 [Leguminivora glycinivorella]|uniref:uncharacterized protein LOC125230220 n=1 Tax=Leguminivora glycinivorella TaxID=1035111 RepID=UPI00200CE8AF|nr:uncharacterized protein LOC125230220 [Leguminivora glycinivorella]